MLYTTLARIRSHSPCSEGWSKLLTHLGKTKADDEPLALLTVLESNGLNDALWCLQAEQQHANIWRLYAVTCALNVRHLMRDPRTLAAVDMAERHAFGRATNEELAAAGAAADAAMKTDFKALLAAHEAQPGESCPLVDWRTTAEA